MKKGVQTPWTHKVLFIGFYDNLSPLDEPLQHAVMEREKIPGPMDTAIGTNLLVMIRQRLWLEACKI